MESFKEAIFTRRMVVINGTFAPLGENQSVRSVAVLWHEAITGRKKEDIIDTFFTFFLHFGDVENIYLWLDNCSAQNKN